MYSTSNPPVKQNVGVSGLSLWSYSSADSVFEVTASGYFSNGHDLGMTPGDTVHIFDQTNSLGSTSVVTSVTAGGASSVESISVPSVDTIAALRLLTAPSDGDIVDVLGYTTAGDHPGVRYKFDSSSVFSDNSGTGIAPSDGTAGLWRMIKPHGSEYDIRWFGVVGDYTGPNLGTDDTVAFQRACDQVSTGNILRIPGGSDFRIRLTDQITIDTWTISIRGQSGGRSHAQIQCDFDDSAKSLFSIVDARTDLTSIRIDMGGFDTTAITQEVGSVQNLCHFYDVKIKNCGKHGILGLDIGLSLERCEVLSADGQGNLPTQDDLSIGIMIGTDGMADHCYTDAGFYFGFVGWGTAWQSVGGIYDQAVVGMLALEGAHGSITGGRSTLNWFCGLMIGAGHWTAIGGRTITQSIRQLQVSNLMLHQNGEDRPTGSDHNENSFDVVFNGPSGESQTSASFSNIHGGQETVGGASDVTTGGVLLAGHSLERGHFIGGKLSNYVTNQSVFTSVTSTAWAGTTAYSAEDVVFVSIGGDEHSFRCTTAGTSGSVAPSHTNFEIVADGTAAWGHIGLRLVDADSVVTFEGMVMDEGAEVQISRKRYYAGVEVESGILDPSDNGIITKTDDYVLVRNDTTSGGKTIVMNKGTANTLTVQPFVTVAALVGEQFSVFCKGAGTTTVTPGAAVTITGTATVAQNESGVFKCIALNEWARVSS